MTCHNSHSPSLAGNLTRRAVFLDRDGTINVEKNYLYKIEDFEFIPGAAEAIKMLKAAGFLVIVVSNQSGIARGLFTEEAVRNLHQHIQDELAMIGTSVDAFYFCPHHPERGLGEYRVSCDCRKGAPGLLLRAAMDYDIDLGQSFMIGDKMSDVEAGIRAGCQSLLVQTGYGEVVVSKSEQLQMEIEVFADLYSAAKLILDKFVEN